MMVKGYIDHSTLGRVIVTVNPRARRFTARWKGVQLHLTVPAGVNVASTTRALDTMAVKLLASKPSPYDIEPGRRIDFDYFFIVFGRSAVPDEVRSRLVHDESGRRGVEIAIGSALDPSDRGVEKLLAKHMRPAARSFASHLLDEAVAVSSRLGVAPAGWSVGSGAGRLGSCGADRHISISCMCVFLPYRLREYIICHELAHLTHFDHSAEFHALCSRYCGGDGTARRAELKSFRWPVPR